jgi:uncharacterized protein YbjT (DUF2867 family)
MSSDLGNKKILVVGATGFLGKKILQNLVNEPNFQIRAMSRKEIKTDPNSKVEWVRADLLDRDSLETALKDIDIVVSSANGYMKESLEMDLIGNKNLIESH